VFTNYSIFNQKNLFTNLVSKFNILLILKVSWNVNIINISTSMLPPKTRRVGKFVGKRTQYKKAFVKLKEGDTITELFN
jgi:large subunit ribosomal protein L23